MFRTVLFEFYEEAAKQAHPKAQLNLADCYETGFGVEKDEEKAAKLRQQAASQEHSLLKPVG